MPYSNSPLESLAAFAIVFLAGAISFMASTNYIEKIKRDARQAHSTN